MTLAEYVEGDLSPHAPIASFLEMIVPWLEFKIVTKIRFFLKFPLSDELKRILF